MKKAILQDILKLRVSIGYLGEAGQHGWWSSSFFSATSSAFLSPVFSRTRLTAQYYGVKQAATLVHDEHIGVGKGVFHLFRLPETHEIEMHRLLNNPDIKTAIQHLTENQASAEQFLNEFGQEDDIQTAGPVKVGDTDKLSAPGSWATVASRYLSAFISENKIFPYFTATQ